MLCCQNNLFMSLRGLSNILSCDILRKRTKPNHLVCWMSFIFSRCTCWNQEDVKERVRNSAFLIVLYILQQWKLPSDYFHSPYNTQRQQSWVTHFQSMLLYWKAVFTSTDWHSGHQTLLAMFGSTSVCRCPWKMDYLMWHLPQSANEWHIWLQFKDFLVFLCISVSETGERRGESETEACWNSQLCGQGKI